MQVSKKQFQTQKSLENIKFYSSFLKFFRKGIYDKLKNFAP